MQLVVQVDVVYKSETGEHIYVDGKNVTTGKEFKLKSVSEFISLCRNNDCKQSNFKIVRNSEIHGKDCSLEFKEMLSLDELIKRYPKQKIALSPYVTVTGSWYGSLKHGVVVWHGKYSEAVKVRDKYSSTQYYWMATAGDLTQEES